MAGWKSPKGGAQQATRHVPRHVGAIWYVDGVGGDDGNSGLEVDQAFLTIGAAILACAAGDAIAITAATYTEVGLDVNKNAVELWFEIGALIDPASGTALTISGDFCMVKGMHKITPAGGEIGLLVSGDECHIEHGRILGGATGVSVTGAGSMFFNYAVGFPTVAAYDITGAQTRLDHCATVGNAATIGYHINGGADTGILRDCTSVGHTSAGYYIDTLSQDWTLFNCSSGAGDGRWVDVDHVNVWSNFSYDGEVTKTTTFAGVPTEYNMFVLTGTVRLSDLAGHVTTVIPNTPCTVYLQLYSTNGTVDITVAPGVDIDSAVQHAFLERLGPSNVALVLADPSAGPAKAENLTYKDPKAAMDIVADPGATTYVRVVLSAALASGAIHWHGHWDPLTDDGFLTPA